MIVKVKKLWKGQALVRDYIVKKTIKQKEDLTVFLVTGEHKIYSYKSLKTYIKNAFKTEFKSSFTGERYYLINFLRQSLILND